MTKEQKRERENLRDSELISQYKQGDTSAFTKLVEFHQNDLYWVNYKILKNRPEAEDATQEQFITAFRELSSDKYNQNTSFRAWLYTTAHHYIHNLQQKRTVLTDHPEELPELPTELPENELETEEKMNLVRKFLKSLSPRDAKIVMLRLWKQLPFKEIAKRMKLTEKGASGIYSRNLTEFRNSIPKNIF